MAIFAIGDVQGCYRELQLLLEKIKFSDNDFLYFVGDLVNRGPESLQVLHFIKNLKNQQTILGNHDLYLLAIAYNVYEKEASHTLTAILTAKDKEELLYWLCQQKLCIHIIELNYYIAHAGFYPFWTFNQAMQYAKEVENVLQNKDFIVFLKHMYGNLPNKWCNNLEGYARLRFIINSFTRMRYLDKNGALDFTSNEPPLQNKHLVPWFNLINLPSEIKIIFGHWASLNGVTNKNNIFAIDTGCIWGRSLTAFSLETQERFSVTKL